MYSNSEEKRFFELSKTLLSRECKIEDLENLKVILRYHEWRYYVQNDPVISDFEYDSLYKKLEKIEAEHPDLVTLDSPTQRVSSDLSGDFESVNHLNPMLSLDNSYNADDLKKFDEQIHKLTGEEGDIVYSVEPKYDGGSIALVYENNHLIRGATRGNGAVGESITHNVKVISSIPLSAKFDQLGAQTVELRGEVLIRKSHFEKLNAERLKEGQSVFANPRNAATGGLRMKDPREAQKRKLDAFIYQIAYAVDEGGNSVLKQIGKQSKGIEDLQNLGFKVPVKAAKICQNIEEAIEFCAEMEAQREEYPYEIDGMVVKVNDFELQEKCGYTQHHPRWAIAYKFRAKQATTKLMDVVYQVGKIGTITPVAKVEPVHLAGVTVSSISLHNEEFIESKDLHLGDTILIERAGDVIPYVVKALPELRDGSEQKIAFPKFCPVNDQEQKIELVKMEDEAAWRCPNCICGKQDLQKMIFHVSKPAMDIDGFGKSYVELFYNMGWLKDLADIYQLDYSKVAELEGFGEKSVDNLKAAIEKAKNQPLHRLLHSLSIHHLGTKAAKLIAREIQSIWELKDWSLENYTDIKDIGPVVANNMLAFFKEEKNLELLQKLEAAGVNMEQSEEDKPIELADDAPLNGKTILFTGSLQHLKRKEAQQLAEQAGAKNISAVSSNLDILVVGEKAGSKLKKAEALGTVQVLTEEAFLQMIDFEF
jgi:DNA ligase (NAD+)